MFAVRYLREGGDAGLCIIGIGGKLCRAFERLSKHKQATLECSKESILQGSKIIVACC